MIIHRYAQNLFSPFLTHNELIQVLFENFRSQLWRPQDRGATKWPCRPLIGLIAAGERLTGKVGAVELRR